MMIAPDRRGLIALNTFHLQIKLLFPYHFLGEVCTSPASVEETSACWGQFTCSQTPQRPIRRPGMGTNGGLKPCARPLCDASEECQRHAKAIQRDKISTYEQLKDSA